MANLRVPVQRDFLKLFPNFCGSEPWAGPADCAAHYASSLASLETEKRSVREAIRRQRYKTSSKVLPDHTIIHRPDCVIRCNEQTALRTMIVHLKLDDRLSVLRAEDRFRKWRSLEDERLCIICKRKFNGRQVEIRRSSNGKYELHCPTEGCNSRPPLWISSATPLVAHVIESDWWRAAGKKRESRASIPALSANGPRL